MTWSYTRAENGNVALIGGIVLPADGAEFLLVLAFGATPRKRDIARAPRCTMASTPRMPNTCASGTRGRTVCCVSTSTDADDRAIATG